VSTLSFVVVVNLNFAVPPETFPSSRSVNSISPFFLVLSRVSGEFRFCVLDFLRIASSVSVSIEREADLRSQKLSPVPAEIQHLLTGACPKQSRKSCAAANAITQDAQAVCEALHIRVFVLGNWNGLEG
jgi:hypothetical protein